MTASIAYLREYANDGMQLQACRQRALAYMLPSLVEFRTVTTRDGQVIKVVFTTRAARWFTRSVVCEGVCTGAYPFALQKRVVILRMLHDHAGIVNVVRGVGTPSQLELHDQMMTWFPLLYATLVAEYRRARNDFVHRPAQSYVSWFRRDPTAAAAALERDAVAAAARRVADVANACALVLAELFVMADNAVAKIYAPDSFASTAAQL